MTQAKNRFSDFSIDAEAIEYLSDAARQCRGDILTMTTLAASGHPGGSMSSLEIYLALYYFLGICPQTAACPDRDRIIVSHGHTSPGVYSVLGRLGFINIEDAITGFRKAGSPYEGHIERHLPGVEWSTGNLGQGLSAGCGFALASKMKGFDSYTFVVMGDGEQQKGQIAEARRFAVKHGLTNLFAIVDLNGLQISGAIDEVMTQDIAAGYRADGWDVYDVDGHDIEEIYNAVQDAIRNGGPAMLLARTVMGKGVSFMENVKDYHGKALTVEQLDAALTELGLPNRYEEFKARRAALAAPAAHPATRSEFPALVKPAMKTYPTDRKIDNRSAYGEALADLGKANASGGKLPVAVFDCDLAGSVKTDGFAKLFPANFFQSGIQEHSTATTAGALSIDGVLSVFSDFGVFGVDEVYNQQRLNDINATNLKIVCTHVGVDVGEDGKTHQNIDYLGLMRNLYGFEVILPADGNQTYRAVADALTRPGNCLIAMGRSVTPIVTGTDGFPLFGENYSFSYGAMDLVRPGADVAIFTYGIMLYRALAIREILKQQGVDVMVVNVPCPLKPDVAKLAELAGQVKAVVSYEDHNVRTGLGSILASELYGAGVLKPLLQLGVEGYCFSGKPEDVFELIGLSPAKAAERIRLFLRR